MKKQFYSVLTRSFNHKFMQKNYLTKNVANFLCLNVIMPLKWSLNSSKNSQPKIKSIHYKFGTF